MIEIYKVWCARAMKDWLEPLPAEAHYLKEILECLDRIIEELVVISEERNRMLR